MSEQKKPRKITTEMIRKHWPYAIDYLAEILNGKYSPVTARKDILSLIKVDK